jgi:hypothetical protein
MASGHPLFQAELQVAAKSSEKIGKKEKEKDLVVIKKKTGDEAVQVRFQPKFTGRI